MPAFGCKHVANEHVIISPDRTSSRPDPDDRNRRSARPDVTRPDGAVRPCQDYGSEGWGFESLRACCI